jgi:hypothetical protein
VLSTNLLQLEKKKRMILLIDLLVRQLCNCHIPVVRKTNVESQVIHGTEHVKWMMQHNRVQVVDPSNGHCLRHMDT